MERFDITIRMYSADASGTQYVWDKVPAEEGDFVLYTDAQATIATLQAERDTARRRVDELEAREVDAVMLREDLEQRTAELEAAKRERDKIVEARQNMLQSMANWLAQLKPTHHPLYRKGVEEVIAAAFNGYRTDKGQPVLLSEWQEQQIRLANPQAELERVRGELVETSLYLQQERAHRQGME